MADKKITELTEATQLQDNDIFPIVQNSETKRITVANARAKFKGDKGENGQDGQQGPAGPEGTTINCVKVTDEQTAISQSAANPNNIYYW